MGVREMLSLDVAEHCTPTGVRDRMARLHLTIKVYPSNNLLEVFARWLYAIPAGDNGLLVLQCFQNRLSLFQPLATICNRSLHRSQF